MEEWKRLEKINELKDLVASKEDDIERYCKKVADIEIELDRIEEQLKELKND